MVTDNGPQFVSSEFTLFLQRNGIKHIRVSPYHPASNGAAERLVQSFKRSLSAAAASTVSIRQRLAEFLLSYRTTPHATTGRTPFSLLMNRECRTRLSLLRPNIMEHVRQKQAGQAAVSTHIRTSEFYVGDRVFARDIRGENGMWAPSQSEQLQSRTLSAKTMGGCGSNMSTISGDLICRHRIIPRVPRKT